MNEIVLKLNDDEIELLRSVLLELDTDYTQSIVSYSLKKMAASTPDEAQEFSDELDDLKFRRNIIDIVFDQLKGQL